MTSEAIIRYKQQIISLFIHNEALVELINNTEVSTPEELIGQNIFGYIRVPQVPEEAKTYIALKIDVPEVYLSNSLFKKIIITVYAITHEDLMHTELGGSRIDLMGEEIERILNKYKGMGKSDLELISNIEDNVGTKHRCRILRFVAQDVNIVNCGK